MQTNENTRTAFNTCRNIYNITCFTFLSNQDKIYYFHPIKWFQIIFSSPSILVCDILVFFLFCSFFFSIYRDIWGTISWSIWCSEHWCRHLGNARKAKQWLWCVTCISQALWHDLLTVTYCRFARSFHCGIKYFPQRADLFFAFTLLMIFVTFLSNAFLFIFNLIFSLFASFESRCACSAITIFSLILSGFGFL